MWSGTQFEFIRDTVLPVSNKAILCSFSMFKEMEGLLIESVPPRSRFNKIFVSVVSKGIAHCRYMRPALTIRAINIYGWYLALLGEVRLKATPKTI